MHSRNESDVAFNVASSPASPRSMPKAQSSDVSNKTNRARGPVSRFVQVAVDRLKAMIEPDTPAACFIWLVIAVYVVFQFLIMVFETILFALVVMLLAIPDCLFNEMGCMRAFTEWYWCVSLYYTNVPGLGRLAGPIYTTLETFLNVFSEGYIVLVFSFCFPLVLIFFCWLVALMLDFFISLVVVFPMILVQILLLIITFPFLCFQAVINFHVSYVNKIIKFVNFWWRLNIRFTGKQANNPAVAGDVPQNYQNPPPQNPNY